MGVNSMTLRVSKFGWNDSHTTEVQDNDLWRPTSWFMRIAKNSFTARKIFLFL